MIGPPLKSYKFKIRRPSKAFVAQCEHALTICCEIYNAALQERSEAWKREGKLVTFYDQVLQLPAIRDERKDVGDLYARVLESPLRRLDHAFKGFFRRIKTGEKAGYPRFRSSSRYRSFTYRQGGFKLAGDKLSLSKLGACRLRLSRPVIGTIRACTIQRQIDGWFVVFAVEENQSPWFPRTGDAIGIDVGIENFATFSTGEVIDNPRYLKRAEKRLRTAHRTVSRKRRGSSNRCKRVRLLARHHLKIQRQRLDFFHKTSLQIVKEFDLIAVEKLNIKGMVKNRHLAKSISDASWFTFVDVLTAKAENAGRAVSKVAARFTSQDCSGCGARVRKTLAIREHRCVSCGLVLHRDHNAALNILARAEPLGMENASSPRELRIAVLSECQPLVV